MSGCLCDPQVVSLQFYNPIAKLVNPFFFFFNL